MKNVIYIVGLVALIAIGFSVKSFLDLKSCNEALKECRKIPDFRSSLKSNKKFVGYVRGVRMKINTKTDDIFNERGIKEKRFSKLFRSKIEDITDTKLMMRQVERSPSLFGWEWVVDWVQEWNFFVDLSNPNDWDIESKENVIIFNCPKVEIDRVNVLGSTLAYAKDRRIVSDDENMLLNIINKSDAFAAIKSREYSNQHQVTIEKEMRDSITEFIKALISKLGYSNDINIEVNFINKA